MKADKPVQAVFVGGAFLQEKGQTKVVPTSKITKDQRRLNGHLVIIRDRKDGTSQVTRLGP